MLSTKIYANEEMVKRGFTEDSKSTLATLIKRARADQGLTQEELARRLDVALQTIQSWEQGRNAPTVRNIRRVLKRVLGIDVDALIRAGEIELQQ